jgi:hypothetical protein
VRLTVAVLAVVMAGVAPGVAQAQNEYFDTLDDHLAGVLRPGDAEVSVAARANTYAAVGGVKVGVVVVARPRGRLRPGTKHRVFVRYKRPRTRCARSYARDHGTIVAPQRSLTHPGVDKRGMNGKVRPSGNVIVGVFPSYRWRADQKVRFCVWLGRKRATRVKPIKQDIVFAGPLFGATFAHDGTVHPPGGDEAWAVGALATVPHRAVFSEKSPDPEPLCNEPPMTLDANTMDSNGIFSTGGEEAAGLLDCHGGHTETWTFTPLSAFGVDTVQGSLSFTDADIRAPVLTSPIRHIGTACDFDASLGRTPGQTTFYVEAVGCRVGRTIVHKQEDQDPYRFGDAAHGEVYGFTLHGGRVSLAPAGTKVDLMVQP